MGSPLDCLCRFVHQMLPIYMRHISRSTFSLGSWFTTLRFRLWPQSILYSSKEIKWSLSVEPLGVHLPTLQEVSELMLLQNFPYRFSQLFIVIVDCEDLVKHFVE